MAKLHKNEKFELTGETKIWLGVKHYRIRAVAAIAVLGIAAGDLGGFVREPENLAATGNAWVHGDALVSGDARVSGNALVSGDARVYGNAWVHGDALVSGDARVYGDALVYGNARVYGNAWVHGNAWVSGDARVYGNARVYGDAWVYGNARVYGDARVYGNARVYGDALVRAPVAAATRSDRYTFLVAPTPDGPRIIAGCRYFTFEQAREHWTRTRGGTPLGDESLALVDCLERLAVIRGFIEPLPRPAAD